MLKPPTIMVCCHDPEWRQRIRGALEQKYSVEDGPGSPNRENLLRRDRPPPDVLLLRFDGPERISKKPYLLFNDWSPGTRFVQLRYRRWALPLLYILIRKPWQLPAVGMDWLKRWLGKDQLPGPLLAQSTPLGEVLRQVDIAAASCWWSQLCELDFPACQLSSIGRILRANEAMIQRFGNAIQNSFFRPSVEQIDDPNFPDHHPVSRAIKSGKACEDYVECAGGSFQYVCLPDQFEVGAVRTVSVLIPDLGSRTRVFDFAKAHKMRSLPDIHEYIVLCAKQLGYTRARLYRLSEDGKELYGVASHGFQDDQKKADFDNGFRFPIEKDMPSQDGLNDPIPVLCIVDPKGKESGERSRLMRTYRRRNFVEELELEGANRWIDAPLVVPGCNVAGPTILGKLAVDRGADSDRLSLRDSLDVGYLAMMGAGAIHAFNESSQEANLRGKEKFLRDLLDALPRFAFETNDEKFYRAIAAILSCHLGLRWQQVMLFVVDSSSLMKQASCVMALGGRGEPGMEGLRGYLEGSFRQLHDYIDNALRSPEPNDSLYQAWAKHPGKHRIVSFADVSKLEGPVAKLLSGQGTGPWQEISVAADTWCQAANSQFPNTFAGPRVFAYPLTTSFALDAPWNASSSPVQPVGVALVGMSGQGGSSEPLGLELTRVTLDLLGALIAQRWTSARIQGMFGALSTVYHGKIKQSWDRVRHAAENWSRAPENDDARKAHEVAIEEHEEVIGRVQTALATLKKPHNSKEERLDLGQFLVENKQRWEVEWGQNRSGARLCLDIEQPVHPIHVLCHRLIVRDALTCLIENSVQMASERGHGSVHVRISARVLSEHDESVEITVEDDAGGVDPEMVRWLFVTGVSGRPKGTGHGLALARSELLMYCGDLQYLPSGEPGKAVFQILFRRRTSHVQTPAVSRG